MWHVLMLYIDKLLILTTFPKNLHLEQNVLKICQTCHIGHLRCVNVCSVFPLVMTHSLNCADLNLPLLVISRKWLCLPVSFLRVNMD